MNVLEYQAKDFFKHYGIPVLDSKLVKRPEELSSAIQALGGEIFAVKAQILAGGRGKGGGIKIVKSFQEAEKAVKELLGSYLVTPQTSEKGELVSRVLIEKGCAISKEYYMALLLDPSSSQVVFMVSFEGGMDIEEVSEKSPEKILKLKVRPDLGFQFWQAWDIGEFLGFSTKEEIKQIFSLCQKLYKLFMDKDASLLEINPLVKTQDNELLALDGKMSFDENAFFRHEDLKSLDEAQERDPAEVEALSYGLSYIKLDGDIGCMVNGAGLAMATMDMIKLYGANPANFLDVGGGAEEEKVKKAFEIILKSEVKGILINIFGGIMRCDVIASALIKAAEEMKIQVPLVIRLEGTKSKEGMNKLKESSLDVIVAEDLDSAARKVVEVSKQR